MTRNKNVLFCVADYALEMYAVSKRKQLSELQKQLADVARQVVENASVDQQTAFYALYIKGLSDKAACIENARTQGSMQHCKHKLIKKIAFEIDKGVTMDV